MARAGQSLPVVPREGPMETPLEAPIEKPVPIEGPVPAEAMPSQPRRPTRLWRRAFGVLGFTLVALLVLAVVLYALDYEIEAYVTETDCANDRVVVHTKQFSITHTVTDIPRAQCLLLNEGNFVEYHIRTEHTRLFDVEGGDCIYDSVTGIC